MTQERTTKTQTDPIVVLIGAHSTSQYEDSPSYAQVDVTQEFVNELRRLQNLCTTHGLHEVHAWSSVTWGPGDAEEEFRLQGDSIVVGVNSFWFEAQPKHADGHVETDLQHIDQFLADVASGRTQFGDIELEETQGQTA